MEQIKTTITTEKLGPETLISTIFVERTIYRPAYYETMVFKKGSFHAYDERHYETEADARIGHAKVVDYWMGK